jgi:hypothetical protein
VIEEVTVSPGIKECLILYKCNKRFLFNESKENLVLSVIKNLFKLESFFGKTLITFFPFIATKILRPKLSVKSIVSLIFNSQGRALNA